MKKNIHSALAFATIALMSTSVFATEYFKLVPIQRPLNPKNSQVVFSDPTLTGGDFMDSKLVTTEVSSPAASPSVENASATVDTARSPATLSDAIPVSSKSLVIASRSVGEDPVGADDRESQQGASNPAQGQQQQQQNQQDQTQAPSFPNQQQQMPPEAPSPNQQQHAQQSPEQNQQQQDPSYIAPARPKQDQAQQDQRQEDQRQQRPVKGRKRSAYEILMQGESQAKGFDVETCIEEVAAAELLTCKVSKKLDGNSELGRRESWAAHRAYAKLQDSERDMLLGGMSMEKKAFAKKIWSKVTFWNALKGKDNGMYDFSRCGKKMGDSTEEAAKRTAEQYCTSADMQHSIYKLPKHIRNTLDSIRKAKEKTNPSNTVVVDALDELEQTWLAVLQNPNVLGASKSFDKRKDFDGVLNQNYALKRAPDALMDTGRKALDMTLHPSHIFHADERVARDPKTSAEFEKSTQNSEEGKNSNGTDPSALEYMLGKKRAGRYSGR